MTFRYYDDEYRKHLEDALRKANDEYFAKSRKEAEDRKATVAKSRGSVWGQRNGWVETYNMVVEHQPGYRRNESTCLVRGGEDGPQFEVRPLYGTKPKWRIRVKTDFGGFESTNEDSFDDYESAVQHAMVMALSVAYVEPLALAKKEAEAAKKRVVKPKK